MQPGSDSNIGICVLLQSFPENATIVRLGHVGEDGVLLYGQHSVGVGVHGGAWRHAEESGFWVDGAQAALFVESHPRNVVANALHLVAGQGGHQHRQVGLAASTGESGRNVTLLAFGVGDAEDEHVLGQPSLLARQDAANAKRETLLA